MDTVRMHDPPRKRWDGMTPHLTLMAANWPDPPLCFLCVYWMSAIRLMDSL